jgi:hypothetical protein
VSDAGGRLLGAKSGPRSGNRFGFAAIAAGVMVRNRVKFKHQRHETDSLGAADGALNTEKLSDSINHDSSCF